MRQDKIDQSFSEAIRSYLDRNEPATLEKINKLLRRGYEPENAELRYALAYLFITDALIDRDNETHYWLLSAASEGSPEAAYTLAMAYELGALNFPQEKGKMLQFYRLAAEEGHSEAAYRYAMLLREDLEDWEKRPEKQRKSCGSLLKEEKEAADRMLYQAAAKGHELALELLHGKPVPEKPVENTDQLEGLIRKMEERLVGEIRTNREVLLQAIQKSTEKISAGMEELRRQKLDEDVFFEKVRELVDQTHEEKQQDPDYRMATEQHREHLRRYFGEGWNELNPDSQKALVAASVLAQAGLPDYSWLVIETVSVLESEMKKRFFTGYQSFLCANKVDLNNWPTGLTWNGESSDKCNLGILLGMLDQENKYYSRYDYAFDPKGKYGAYAMKNYLPSIWKEGEPSLLQTFFKCIHKQLVTPRNHAGHNGSTISEEAGFNINDLVCGKACRNLTGRSELEEKGLLRLLLEWTRPKPLLEQNGNEKIRDR